MNEAVQYLLGRMTEEERDAFQERFFADPELFATVESAEVDLLDAYNRGELNAEDRGAVERFLLSSEGQRQRLLVSRALQNHRPSRVWQYAAFALAALLCIGWFSLLRYRGASIEPTVAEQVAVLELPPVAARTSAGLPRLSTQPRSATRLEFRIAFSPALDAPGLKGSFRNGEGKEVASAAARRDENAFVFRLSRGSIPPGAYELAFLDASGTALGFTYFILE